MYLLKLVAMIWFCFGVLTTVGFLWLGRKGVQALTEPKRKEAALDRRHKPAAVISSNAA